MTTERRNGKHWLERNWKWFVPVGCLGFVILSAAFFCGTFLLVMTWIRSSHVFEEAVDRARNDPRVVRELGEPIQTGWWLLGNIHNSGSSGTADLTIPISGPRDSARIYLEAEKRAGVWNFQYLVVEIGGSGERIDLLELPENWIQTMKMRRQDPRPKSVFGQAWDGPLVLPVLTEHRRFAKLTGSDHRRRTPVAPDTLRGEA